MTDPQEVLSSVLDELTRLQSTLKRRNTKQITNADDRALIKSVAYAWFRSHRATLNRSTAPDLISFDEPFRTLLEATDRATTKATYLATIKDAIERVRSLRSSFLVPLDQKTSEEPPDFSSLAKETAMQTILVGRWSECQRCIAGGAHLAATVMMGGLLEALFVARANALSDKSPMYKAKSTPLDSKTKKPLMLKDWTLRPFIDVGHELGWITKSGKDIAVVLRDYRNIIHPEKQRSLGIELGEHDSKMFWEITKSLSRQLLARRQ